MDRPILFSGPMVRALLDGSKTQTRRLVTGTSSEIGPLGGLGFPVRGQRGHTVFKGGQPLYDMCPHGAVGHRLWVREAWGVSSIYDNLPPRDLAPRGMKVNFAADRALSGCKVRPGMFMPRWASRLMLTITDVRVERLQDISVDDAMAEGLTAWSKDGKLVKHGIAEPDGLPGTDWPGAWPWHEWRISPIDAYEKLWDSLNARRAPWESNPFVWVISFEVARA